MKKGLGILGILILLTPSVLGGAFLHDYMYEGETLIIPVNGGYYELRLIIVSDIAETAVFSVNGEITKALREREKDYLSDGSRIFVGDILVDEDGKDLVEFYFMGTGKSVIRDTIVEVIDLPFETAEPGVLEEQPRLIEECDGCRMNGDCYPYGYKYNPEVETTVICAEDGSWREVGGIKQEEPLETLLDMFLNWLEGVFR